MEDELSSTHHEDDALDRELNCLVREMEHEEAVRPNLAMPACSRVALIDPAARRSGAVYGRDSPPLSSAPWN